MPARKNPYARLSMPPHPAAHRYSPTALQVEGREDRARNTVRASNTPIMGKGRTHPTADQGSPIRSPAGRQDPRSPQVGGRGLLRHPNEEKPAKVSRRSLWTASAAPKIRIRNPLTAAFSGRASERRTWPDACAPDEDRSRPRWCPNTLLLTLSEAEAVPRQCSSRPT